MNPNTLDTLLLLFLITIGILMIYVSSNFFKKLNTLCKEQQIRTGMTIMMVLASVFITIPVTYLVCKTQISCQMGAKSASKSSIYMFFILGISIYLITTCGIMLSSIAKDKVNCGGDEAKKSIDILLTISIILFVIICISLFLRYKHIFLKK